MKVAILLTCFAVVFAEETTTSKPTTKTPKKTTSTATAAPVNKNQNNKNTAITTSKPTTKPTKKTTVTTTAASVNSTCGKGCLKVNPVDCVWNQEEESKTDFHYDKIGNCPCPDDPTKDRCNVVQRRVRNIPALQAWSACLFLMSICIAGKFHRIIPYNLYGIIYTIIILERLSTKVSFCYPS